MILTFFEWLWRFMNGNWQIFKGRNEGQDQGHYSHQFFRLLSRNLIKKASFPLQTSGGKGDLISIKRSPSEGGLGFRFPQKNGTERTKNRWEEGGDFPSCYVIKSPPFLLKYNPYLLRAMLQLWLFCPKCQENHFWYTRKICVRICDLTDDPIISKNDPCTLVDRLKSSFFTSRK